MFKIQVTYMTGDSFSDEQKIDVIDFNWKDITKAQQAVADIEQHYEFYKTCNASRTTRADIEAVAKKLKKLKYYSEARDKTSTSKTPEFYSIALQLDDGTWQKVYAFWIGYFERLQALEIIVGEKRNIRDY
jgi:hypothetical protein